MNTVVAQTPNNTLNTLAINAQVTFDDIVNVFVSRYEEQLHQQRANIQRQLKALQQEKAAVITEIRAEVTAVLQSQFDTVDNQVAKKFVITTDEVNNLTDVDTWGAKVVMERHCDYPAGMVVCGYPSQDAIWTLKVDVPTSLVAKWRTFDPAIVHLKEQLMIINNDLQSVDRKTRQIKGVLAERKMQKEGMSDLLESDEIKSILKLSIEM